MWQCISSPHKYTLAHTFYLFIVCFSDERKELDTMRYVTPSNLTFTLFLIFAASEPQKKKKRKREREREITSVSCLSIEKLRNNKKKRNLIVITIITVIIKKKKKKTSYEKKKKNTRSQKVPTFSFYRPPLLTRKENRKTQILTVSKR